MGVTVKRKSNSDSGPAKKAKPELKNSTKPQQEIESEEDKGLSSEEDSSDDNLDNLDEGSDASSNGEMESEMESEIELEDGDEDDSNSGEDLNKKQSISHQGSSEARAKRQEQKRLQKERKLQKAHGREIEEVKKLWERLREKQGVSKNERSKLVQEIMKLVDGNWKDLVFRHDASRVVQTVFKYADKALRQEITAALKGTYSALAKSAYGKYLLIKMMHYGTPKVRADIIDELHGTFRKLMGHKEGAYVLEDCYREYATAKQRRQIMREFYGSEFALFKDAGGDKANLAEIIAENPEKKPYLLENLNKVITQAIGKGSIGFEIVHAMMLEYVRNIDQSPKSMDRETFIDLIADEFVEMVHTNTGSQVASIALAISTAKERKRLLKSLREYPSKLAKDNYGNIVLMSAFLTVDDTKLTHKAFVELETELVEVLCDKYARRPFLMLLVGPKNTKYFGVLQQRFNEVDHLKKEFSKKDDEARRKELLKNFAPALNQTIVQHSQTLLTETLGMQFILEFLLNEDARDPETLEAVLATFEGDPAISKSHPFNVNPFSGRMVKTLIKHVPEARSAVSQMVAKYPVQWATGEGSFAVVALLESLEGSERESLNKKLAKVRKEIEKSDTKARELLLGLIGNTRK